MDKEILRIVIIASGLLVMMAMLLWGYLRSRRTSDNVNLFDGERNIGPLKESLKLHPEHDDYDVTPLSPGSPIAKTSATNINSTTDNSAANKPQTQNTAAKKPGFQPKIVPPPVVPVPVVEQDDDFDIDFEYEPLDLDLKPRASLPAIIQFCIVANADVGFNGVELFDAFESAGLQYGSLKIFERLDAARRVDFGVACMIEPGTFPDTKLESFYCPGIVFFMQHGQLEDALAVFDDYVDTIAYLAQTLDGVAWDHQRQPLTEETVEAIRRSL
jgi:cell division protein ZipA